MKALVTIKTDNQLVVWIFSVTVDEIASIYTLFKARPLTSNLFIQAVEVLPEERVPSLTIPEGKNIRLLDKNVDFGDLLRYLGGIHFDHSQS